MQNLLLPSEVEFSQTESDQEGKLGELIISPCYFGYGTTLGNTLRRVLLSSLPGAAVEAFKIKGVQHEFSAVDGVKEDVVQIILNLKQLALKVYANEPVILKIKKNQAGEVKAKDIEPNAEVEVVNGDLTLATLTTKKEFEMDIIVGRGRGFKPAEEKDKKDFDLGVIVIDSLYNPVRDVGYSVEYIRVGDITNYEKLILRVATNGVITPREAVNQATQIIMDHFNIISSTLADSDNLTEETTSLAEPSIEMIAGDEANQEAKPAKKRVRKTKK